MKNPAVDTAPKEEKPTCPRCGKPQMQRGDGRWQCPLEGLPEKHRVAELEAHLEWAVMMAKLMGQSVVALAHVYRNNKLRQNYAEELAKAEGLTTFVNSAEGVLKRGGGPDAGGLILPP